MPIMTVGHSTLDYDRFLSLVRGAGCDAIADVRSSPYSRHFPHFNREQLKEELRLDNVAYSFLGRELGGRPASPSLYSHGVADYEKMAATSEFHEGLRRVIDGTKKYTIALMCSEHDPLDCHRCLLVGRALSNQGIEVHNILSSGRLVSQNELEGKLLEMADRENPDLFLPPEDRIAMAYRNRAMRVAFMEPKRNVGDTN